MVLIGSRRYSRTLSLAISLSPTTNSGRETFLDARTRCEIAQTPRRVLCTCAGRVRMHTLVVGRRGARGQRDRVLVL